LTWPKALILNLVGAAALSAAVIYNGYPFFYFDTHAYYTGGQKTIAAFSDLACGVGLACPTSATDGAGPEEGAIRPSASTAAEPPSDTISTGRSPFYGVLLYLSEQVASFWLLVAAQALAASWLLYLACAHLLTERAAAGFLAVIAVVTALSALPLFVGYLMPDLFTGLYILAAALLVVCYDRLRRVEIIGLWLLLLSSMLFHRSHVLAAAMLLGVVTIAVIWFARSTLRRVTPALLLIAAAVAAGAAGFVILDVAASRITGRVAISPPFLLARVIEDGPGTSYLREACATERYAVCRFVDRMPIQETDFLWSRAPDVGVWYVVSPEERVRIANEQYTIVLRSFLYAPLAELSAIAGNFGQQVVHFGVEEFEVDDSLRSFVATSFGGAIANAFMNSRIVARGINLSALSILHYVVVVASVVLLALRFRTLEPDLRATILIVLAGMLLNALVTGAISTPDHRFQARVIWLLPALATLVEARRLARPAKVLAPPPIDRRAV
jgi:hypothetical protein